MIFINSIVHGSTMGHPNKRAIRKLRCYESIHENTLFFFCSCNFTLLPERGTFYLFFLSAFM